MAVAFCSGKNTHYHNTSLLKIDGVTDRKETGFYLGKRVAYIYKVRGALCLGAVLRARLRVDLAAVCRREEWECAGAMLAVACVRVCCVGAVECACRVPPHVCVVSAPRAA